MQQVVQSIKNGDLAVRDVPAPRAHKGEVLIANAHSVLSAGTEKMLLDFGKKSWLGKAKARPADLRRVLQKVKQDGWIPTLRDVQSRLSEPMQMGYASAGIVLECGEGVDGLRPGDRVASNGPHAGVVSVPVHLCARVPDGVPLDEAAFGILGAIALQGVRIAKIELGETVLVVGLGLVGQLVVGLLRAAGCRVIGTDPEAAKCETARKMGAEVARPGLGVDEVATLTGGVGADAVIIAASTASNGPIQLAANAVRQKGRVVLVGVVGLELDRDPFFRKEAEFVVSCSYGPGRYDPDYEILGHDYPVGHVRWTEQRNLQAVLECMGQGGLDVSPLVSHRFGIADAQAAYELVHSGAEPFLGVVLDYPVQKDGAVDGTAEGLDRSVRLRPRCHEGAIGVGMLGAGNFARNVLIPAIGACGQFEKVSLCSKRGMTAVATGERHGFELATTEEAEVFENPDVDAVFVLTQHDLHADQVIRALEHGKHVFVEKPLCLDEAQLESIEAILRDSEDVVLTVGFNRRFSPAAAAAKEFFRDVDGPITASFRFNAGALPADHWTQNPEIGGGRIIGEACHAIDTVSWLIGSPPVRVHAESIGGPNAPAIVDDQCFLTLSHADGSVSSIAYLAGGDRAFPRERIELIGGGRVAVVDDFRVVTTVRDGRTRVSKFKKDKGHRQEIAAFADSIASGGDAPIPWTDIRSVTLASILAVRSLRQRTAIDLP